jgi:hypothetical protein
MIFVKFCFKESFIKLAQYYSNQYKKRIYGKDSDPRNEIDYTLILEKEKLIE